jgi:hypothetical protein
VVTGAQAGSFKSSGFSQADFFDFDRARTYWAEMQTREQLDAAAASCDAGAYSAWVKDFKEDSNAAFEALEEHPEASEIKACYDLQLTYNVFARMYSTWQKGRSFRAEPFNENTRMITCTAMSSINVFTGECNDMPDWRKAAWRADDERVLEAYRQRQAERAARRADRDQ